MGFGYCGKRDILMARIGRVCEKPGMGQSNKYLLSASTIKKNFLFFLQLKGLVII